VLLALALLGLAGVSLAGISLVASARAVRRLVDEAPAGGNGLPAVTIVLAARDEAGAIEPAVRSLLAQDYPALEVIAVDDRSSDGTGRILDRLAAADARLAVLHLSALPEGWLGKNHALHEGARRGRGEFLLFTDADVLLAPDALRRAVGAASRGELEHLAVMPEIHARGWLLRASVAAFVFYFVLAIPPWRTRSPRRPEALGIGAFNLVRRRTYAAAGGHAAIPLRPDDDLALARSLKRAGARAALCSGVGVVAVEWYPRLSGLIEGMMKNIFCALGYSGIRAVLAVAAILLGNVLPFAAAPFAPAPARWAFAASAALLVLLVGLSGRAVGLPPASGLLFPAAALIWAWIVARGAITTLRRGEIVWRGTRYPLATLRGGGGAQGQSAP